MEAVNVRKHHFLLINLQSIDQQKKYGGGGNRGGSLSTSAYGTQKKSLGTRYMVLCTLDKEIKRLRFR